jgi:tetratricopeptide (TPR) repeat protein/tRNA A-37 threonylcarbamoyl transferase component Bud32
MKEQIAGYNVVELIGRGGTSSVYKCIDPVSGNVVAIKLFDVDRYYDSDARESMHKHWQQEVTLLEQLAHPSIIRILGSGIDDGNPYIVLEYIDRLREPTLNWKSTVSVMHQVAQALEYAHGMGVIHRDIKPTNILIYGLPDNPRVKISDFGIAMEIIDPNSSQNLSDMSGSCHYISPELIDGRDISPSTDLYGLGLVSYELLVGRKAFDGDSPSQVFGSILIDEPVKPSSFDGAIPAFLDKIILRLLRKNPDERYQNAKELASDLEGLMESDFMGPLPTRMLLKFSQMAPSIGRETELEMLKADLAHAIEGNASVKVVIGPVGMGKSRLVAEVNSIAKAWGFKCINVGCTQDQKEDHFSVISQLTQKLEKSLKSRLKHKTLHQDMFEIHTENTIENPYDFEPYKEIWQIQSDLVHANQNLRPLLLTIDDIHYADNQSLDILQKMLESKWNLRLMIILTANTEYLNPKGMPNKLCEKARSLHKLIRLFPFERHQIREIVESTFGTTIIPNALVDFLTVESSGNPLYLEELLRSLVSQGAIEAINKELILKTSELHTPESLLKLQGISISALNESTGELLRIAAIIGRNFTASLLAETSGRPLPEIEQAIEDAIENMVIESSQSADIETYGFRNDRVRKNLLVSINPRLFAQIHDQAAKAIIKIHDENISEHVDEVALHFLAGTKPQLAIPYLLESSRKHLETFNPGKSLEMASKALELSQPGTDNAFESYICLAQVHTQALQASNAFECSTKADELANSIPLTTPLNKARAMTTLVESLTLLGKYAQAIKLAEKTIDMYGSSSARIVSRLEATIAQNGAHIDCNAAEKHALKAMDSSDGYTSEKVHAMTILSQIQERKGNLEEAQRTLDKAIEFGLEKDPLMPSLAQLELAKIQLFQDCLKREGLENLAKAEESARICQNQGILTMCNITKGQLYFYDGQIEDSISIFTHCEKLIRDSGNLPNLSVILYYLSRSALFLGDLATANKKLIEAKEIQNRTGWTMLKSILALEIDISIATQDNLRSSQAVKDYAAKALKSNPEVEGECRYLIACSKFELEKKNYAQAFKLATKSYELARDHGVNLSSINSQIQVSDSIIRSIRDGAKTSFVGVGPIEYASSALDDGFITAIQSGFKMPVINCSVARGRLLFEWAKSDNARSAELTDQANSEYEKARLLAIESGNIRLATTIESEKTLLSSGG